MRIFIGVSRWSARGEWDTEMKVEFKRRRRRSPPASWQPKQATSELSIQRRQPCRQLLPASGDARRARGSAPSAPPRRDSPGSAARVWPSASCGQFACFLCIESWIQLCVGSCRSEKKGWNQMVINVRLCGRAVGMRRVKHTGVADDQVAGLHRHVDLAGVVAEAGVVRIVDAVDLARVGLAHPMQDVTMTVRARQQPQAAVFPVRCPRDST